VQDNLSATISATSCANNLMNHRNRFLEKLGPFLKRLVRLFTTMSLGQILLVDTITFSPTTVDKVGPILKYFESESIANSIPKKKTSKFE
jgi:hypothetical protein